MDGIMGSKSAPIETAGLVFVLNGMAREVPVETVFKGILPFFLAMRMVILVLIVFTQIVLFLPNTMIRAGG